MIWEVENSKKKLRLLTPEQFKELPNGTELFDIFGKEAIKGKDNIDMDTRGGYIAYGIEVKDGERN